MKRKTDDDWKNIILEQQASGLIASEYCRQNNINPKYFSHRKTRLEKKQSPFITAKAPVHANTQISLTWNGMRLEFAENTAPAAIANLMKALHA